MRKCNAHCAVTKSYKNPRGGAGWGGAKVKIHGAGRGKIARKSTNSPNFTKVHIDEEYNITYYKNNYKVNHNISRNKYCIRTRDYDHPFLIIILE